MERLVTPPRQGTSPTWGPPPPCEHALSPWGNGKCLLSELTSVPNKQVNFIDKLRAFCEDITTEIVCIFKVSV